MKTSANTPENQLELGFNNPADLLSPRTKRREPSRAHWWFNRMRSLAEHALDWEPTPPPRPHQEGLPNIERQAPTAKAA
jgi:hypothetical protein